MTKRGKAPASGRSNKKTTARFLSAFVVAFVLLGVTVTRPSYADDTSSTITLRQSINSEYYTTSIWDDGKAEVARYRATRVVYGAQRPHDTILITVSEDFDTATYTKAEPPYGETTLLPVIKFAIISTIQTPNYPYHFMTTSFIDREDPATVLKLSTSSQEWCGVTSRVFERWRIESRERFQSYWQNEGAGSRAVALRPGDLFEEDLPVVLRALKFADGLRASFRLASSVTVARTPPITISPAVLRVEVEDELWQVRINAADGRAIRLGFDTARDNVLQSMEHSDGRALELSEVSRKAYWLRGEADPLKPHP